MLTLSFSRILSPCVSPLVVFGNTLIRSCSWGVDHVARRDICGEKINWSSTFGVTSVHNFDISMFTPPTGAMEGWFVKADVDSRLWGGERGEVVATQVL